MERIYLDHAATTPVHPKAAEAMMPYFTSVFGNPSSTHHYGRESKAALQRARRILADAVGASAEEIVLTAGGTEADNLAIMGYARNHHHLGRHIITAVTEHHGVLHACQALEKEGFSVTYLNVDSSGLIRMEELEEALRDDTILVSLMTANNETGVVQPIQAIGDRLKEHQAVFHTDAVQAVGKREIHVSDLGVDMLAASAHKFNGPNGTGFLYVRKGIQLSPLLHGGSQERKRRAGTESTALAAGMAEALRLTLEEMELKQTEQERFRRLLLTQLEHGGAEAVVNGHPEERLSNVLNISFPGANVEQLLMNLDLEGIAVSSGSACTAGSIEASHVLTAMHGDSERGRSAVRFSFGLGTTDEQINRTAETLLRVLQRMKMLN
ncbi:cysteine desulfurase family protein [Alkalicoccus luteus]|uniref:cysteine desulfurase n=1 Tax=Alkalicoccus luteus TaxID=1237094 RepID=A0A969PQG8_9BACI|nr:cysteine desulfurase family protein [Alkalicoccus luteus]NJP36556.1 cysteine desulfurase [Alkalicoccus luteus]